MIKSNKILLTIAVVVLLTVGFRVVVDWSKVQDHISQENDGGNVKIIVTPKTLVVGEKPNFDIVFETHLVDLNFDVAQISSLIDEKGRVFDKSIWEGTGPGGHHRSGTLTFNTVLSKTKSVILIIKGVAGVSERKFSWKI